MQIYKGNKFFNVQNSTKCFISVSITTWLPSFSLVFFVTHKTILSFNFFTFVTSLFLLIFASCFPAIFQCSIPSSCDIDSALSVSGSCNTSVAILTLLEAVLQHFCSSTLCLQQRRGSTLDSLFLQKLLWRHNVTFLSKSSFNISSFSLPSRSLILEILFTAVVTAFRLVIKKLA